MEVRTRFAPSPTGFMHIGNLRTALYAYLYAKNNNGKFLLRIEDTDRERYTAGAVEIIYSTLKAAGIEHDEGPDVGGAYGPYIQSDRKEIYKNYALELVKLGGAYFCFCSKERLESLIDENGNRRYDKHCANIPYDEAVARALAGEQYVIRQNVPTTGLSEYDDMVYGHIVVKCEELEDNVLIKSDGMPTYNFANVVDDHLMNITHVIRGTEYLSSTPKYNLVYDSFGWARPLYMHLPPIMKDAQRKLSKRFGDANFDDFLKKGYLPEAIVNYIALLGWSPKDNNEKLTMEELIKLFNVAGLNRSSSIFDEAKMRWLNGEYIKKMSPSEFVEVANPYFEGSKVCGKYDYIKLAPLLIPRVEILSEIPKYVDFLEEYEEFDLSIFCHTKMKTDCEIAKRAIKESIEVLRKIDEWSHDNIHDALISLAGALGMKNGQVLWSVRVGITGKMSTAGGAIEIAELLGKSETIRRLEFALNLLENKYFYCY